MVANPGARYVVEKIMSHMIDKKVRRRSFGVIGDGWGANGSKQGVPLYEVKWEGYDKKSDRTWEPEENLV